jgi:hypothetical protein
MDNQMGIKRSKKRRRSDDNAAVADTKEVVADNFDIADNICSNNANILAAIQPPPPEAVATMEVSLKDFVEQIAIPPTYATKATDSTTVEVIEQGNRSHEQQQQQPQQYSIQTSLNQLGNDISLIKTQLVRKKTKATLVDVNNKLDRILHHLKGTDSGSGGTGDSDSTFGG